ncbi:MAG TPA: NAD(P)-binding domain-containing protein [Myxococcaceae bacterium]|nr:NAD(P)-binding domain-containing protein [Myxococcaceae bacterium]
MTHSLEAAIVGAGPYGLSVAAHLRALGIPHRIFGRPMRTWTPMPRSLSLKSLGFATSIALPEGGGDFPGWLRERGLETLEPISYADFADYGLWVQKRHVPGLEPTDVARLEDLPEGGYQLTLESGERLRARQVVVAVGLGYFQRIPAELAPLGQELVSHTFGRYDFAPYAGREVAVIGAGQSALEAAVLLHEVGAHPTLVARTPPVFHGRTPARRSLLERIREPLTVLGAGRKHWVLEHLPWLVHYAPEERRVHLARTYLGPAGAWWLRDRFVDRVPVLAPARLLAAREERGEVVLRLSVDGGTASERRFAHVVCGSGFEHDVRRLPFLDAGLVGRLGLIRGRAPRLSRRFESTRAGLYFVGPISAYAFGPLFRFVCGTTYAAPTVARRLAARARLSPAGREVPAAAPERPGATA